MNFFKQISHSNNFSPVCVRMCTRRDVICKVIKCDKYLTRVRALAGMHSLMVLQLMFRIERHRACCALVRFVTGMNAQMPVQIATLKYINLLYFFVRAAMRWELQ